jgi:hypothetical protein
MFTLTVHCMAIAVLQTTNSGIIIDHLDGLTLPSVILAHEPETSDPKVGSRSSSLQQVLVGQVKGKPEDTSSPQPPSTSSPAAASHGAAGVKVKTEDKSKPSQGSAKPPVKTKPRPTPPTRPPKSQDS